METKIIKMKGITFKTPEVEDILAGRKNTFILKVNKQPNNIINSPFFKSGYQCEHGYQIKCPYEEGQKIFIKEDFAPDPRKGFNYRAYFPEDHFPKEYSPDWINARFMKQHQSRIKIKIQDIRVVRFQELEKSGSINNVSWESNPWVWVFNFNMV